jgi:CheY-like chemotaxis protein
MLNRRALETTIVGLTNSRPEVTVIPMAPQHAPESRLLALLVDRDADTRQMYAEYLALDQWRTEEAEDGREALAKAIAAHPDVVVTETRLPGLSGYDLCSILRRDESTRSIPIVVVTADAYAPSLDRAQSAGADAVLVKPCLPETLLLELKRVVARAEDVRARSQAALERAEAVLERARRVERKAPLKRSVLRGDTVSPPQAPPVLVCPLCDKPLLYRRSHFGGVNESHQEQWDYFDCPGACGTFQYRVRTRKLKRVG